MSALFKNMWKLEVELSQAKTLVIKEQDSKIRAYKNLVIAKNDEIEDLKKELFEIHKINEAKDKKISEVERCLEEYRKILNLPRLDVRV